MRKTSAQLKCAVSWSAVNKSASKKASAKIQETALTGVIPIPDSFLR